MLPPVALALRLYTLAAPPSVSELASVLRDCKARATLRTLVRELLPEKAKEIIGMPIPVEKQLEAFQKGFSEHYFPIVIPSPPWAGSLEECLRQAVPEPMAIGFEEYTQGFDPGLSAIVTLCRSPLEDMCMMDGEYQEGQPIDPDRTMYLDGLADIVGAELAGQVPLDGIEIEVLRQRLRGTRFAPVVTVADLLFHESNWIWFNLVYQDIDDGDYYENVEEDGFQWDMKSIEAMSADWRRAKAEWDAMKSLIDWLEEDMPNHVAEMVRAALGPAPVETRANTPLVEVFSTERSEDDVAHSLAP
ncbi:MAG: hypothetical protein Q7K03_07855 [Dehalococcoidia bacterium]|nr:hypothetical protein [Dehalococcoidia bacterium]